MLKRSFALLRVLASAFALLGMSGRKYGLMRKLFPGRTRLVLVLLGHPAVNVLILAGIALQTVDHMMNGGYIHLIGAAYVVISYLILRRMILFRDRPQDLEPTSVKDQQTWVATQDSMVQRRYARCEQPLHKDTWKELQRLANGLDDVARTKAVKRAANLDAVLPQAPTNEAPPRRF